MVRYCREAGQTIYIGFQPNNMPRKKTFDNDKIGSRRSSRNRTQKRDNLSDSKWAKDKAAEIRQARLDAEYENRKERLRKVEKRDMRSGLIWDLERDISSKPAIVKTFKQILYTIYTECPACLVSGMEEVAVSNLEECAIMFREIAILVHKLLCNNETAKIQQWVKKLNYILNFLEPQRSS